MVTCVKWSRAEGHKRLSHQCELDHLHRTGRAARTVRRECRNTVHFGIRQHRCVEGGGFYCFLSVPKIRDYFRHRCLPCEKDAESRGATREISVQATMGSVRNSKILHESQQIENTVVSSCKNQVQSKVLFVVGHPPLVEMTDERLVNLHRAILFRIGLSS